MIFPLRPQTARKSLDHIGSASARSKYTETPKKVRRRSRRANFGFWILDFGLLSPSFTPAPPRRESEKATETAARRIAIHRGGAWVRKARGTDAARRARPQAARSARAGAERMKSAGAKPTAPKATRMAATSARESQRPFMRRASSGLPSKLAR